MWILYNEFTNEAELEPLNHRKNSIDYSVNFMAKYFNILLMIVILLLKINFQN